MNFAELIQHHAELDPDRPAIVTPASTTTYQELSTRIRGLPVCTGQVVALDVKEPADYVACFVGFLRAGARVLPITPSMPIRVRDEVIKQTSAKIVTHAFRDVARDIDRAGEVLHFTSGSTGAQKIAVRPFGNLMDEAVAVSQRMTLTKDSRVMITSPMEHSFGCGVMRACLVAGASMFAAAPLVRGARVTDLKWIAGHWATVITGVPYFFGMLTRVGSFVTSARSYYGGESMSPGVRERWKGALYQEYGLSESGIVTTATPMTPLNGSIGSPIPRVRVELDEDGELIVYRPHSPSRYFFGESPETFLTDGGVRTGDIGLKSGPLLYLLGRKKDIINIGGRKVVPSEIENAALEHPDIDEVVVLGIRENTTERPVIFVLSDRSIPIHEIRAFLRDKLDGYKLPIRVKHVTGGDWPRTSTGKIDRELLRASI